MHSFKVETYLGRISVVEGIRPDGRVHEVSSGHGRVVQESLLLEHVEGDVACRLQEWCSMSYNLCRGQEAKGPQHDP